MSDKGTITFVCAEQDPKYGDLKVFVDSPREARDAINDDDKGLDWDKHHQTWSQTTDWAENGYWLIDVDHIHEAAEHLEEAGWTVESELPLEIFVPEDFNE